MVSLPLHTPATGLDASGILKQPAPFTTRSTDALSTDARSTDARSVDARSVDTRCTDNTDYRPPQV